MIIIVASVGVSIDILATQHGYSDYVYDPVDDVYRDITADITYTSTTFGMEVNYFDEWDKHKHVSYRNATDEACDTEDVYKYTNSSNICARMKDVRDGGEAYYALFSSGISFLSLASVCVLLFHCMVQCLEWPMRKAPCRYLIIGFVFIALVMFIAAWSVFYNVYVSNLNDVLDYLIARYWTDVYAAIDNWNDGQSGPSMGCLLAAILMTVSALITAMCFDADNFDPSSDRAEYERVDGAHRAAATGPREVDTDTFL
jgi:hypothetical protein